MLGTDELPQGAALSQPTQPTPTPIQPMHPPQPPPKKKSGWAAAAVILAVVALVVLFIVYGCWNKEANPEPDREDGEAGGVRAAPIRVVHL